MRVNRARTRGVLGRLAARETRNPFPRTHLSLSPRARCVKIFFGRCVWPERIERTSAIDDDNRIAQRDRLLVARGGVPARCVKMGDDERPGEGISVETSSQRLATLHNDETLVATRGEVECRFAPRRDFHSRFRSLARSRARSTSRSIVHSACILPWVVYD